MIWDRRRPYISVDPIYELTRQRIEDLRDESRRSRRAKSGIVGPEEHDA